MEGVERKTRRKESQSGGGGSLCESGWAPGEWESEDGEDEEEASEEADDEASEEEEEDEESESEAEEGSGEGSMGTETGTGEMPSSSLMSLSSMSSRRLSLVIGRGPLRSYDSLDQVRSCSTVASSKRTLALLGRSS